MATQPKTDPGKKPPQKERRINPRHEPPDAKIWVISGEFKEVRTAVNFAKELVNISLGGCCIVASGQLRPGVKMKVEIDIPDKNGKVKAEGSVVHARTEARGGYEFFIVGIRFDGAPTLTGGIGPWLRGEEFSKVVGKKVGGSKSIIVRLKERLKGQKSGLVAGEDSGPGGGWFKKLFLFFVILLILYVGSFWGLVLTHKDDSPTAIRFYYLGKDHAGEKMARAVYTPAYKAFRMMIKLDYLGE